MNHDAVYEMVEFKLSEVRRAVIRFLADLDQRNLDGELGGVDCSIEIPTVYVEKGGKAVAQPSGTRILKVVVTRR